MLSQTDIEIIYEQNIDKIYRYFYLKFSDKEIAEDLTSEVFLEFVKKAKDIEFENPKSYLYGIARKTFLKHLQKKYKENSFSYSDIDDFSSFVNEYVTGNSEYETRIKLVVNQLDKLPEKQMIILRLRIVDKLTPSEIAGKLNKDLNYVKTTQKRGIKSLKKLLACIP